MASFVFIKLLNLFRIGRQSLSATSMEETLWEISRKMKNWIFMGFSFANATFDRFCGIYFEYRQSFHQIHHFGKSV